MAAISFYRLLADLTLFAHAVLVLFVVGGQILTLIGWIRAWTWTRGRLFRVTHLLCIGVVALEAWFDVTCPLTTLENYLRGRAGQSIYSSSFVGAWLDRYMFYTAPDWAFVVVYSVFALLVVTTYICYPPQRRHG